jgi:hypothetical protein
VSRTGQVTLAHRRLGQSARSLTESGEHTREHRRLNLPISDHEIVWETVETIDLWIADPKTVG